jgi:hypothetical protein
MITLHSPTLEDCRHLMSNLRSRDRDEVLALGSGIDGDRLWQACREAHEAHSVYEGDDLVCIFGVQPEGIVWLLGTAHLDRRLLKLCKLAPAFIARWSQRFPKLFNMTDKRNTRIILWLRWLGFQFGESVDVNGHTFLLFSKVRHV